MEERRFGQTPPDVLALNPQLEADLANLAGGCRLFGQVSLHLSLRTFKVNTALMMPRSYISEREVDYSASAAKSHHECSGKHFSSSTWCNLELSSTFRPGDRRRQTIVMHVVTLTDRPNDWKQLAFDYSDRLCCLVF